MPDEAYLRERARTAVRSGKLPARAPDRTWGGPGVGAQCAVCEKPITKAELEFEIEFARNGEAPGLDKYHVHVRCFAAWEFERRNGQA
jgi:phytoene dehydrogenase-like protein